jgi:hypothetical protein
VSNKLSRSPGDFATVTPSAQPGSVPNFAVAGGSQSADALAQVGQQLSQRIGVMADRAASREGEMAGLEAGARAGSRYVEKSTLEARGDARQAAAGPATPGKPQKAATDELAADAAPLQLRRDGTIRGEAFDAAAVQTYGWRMQQGLVTDLATAFDQNDSSPGGYDAAIQKVQQKFLADPMLNDPVVRESFEKLWAEKTTIGRMTVANRHAAAVRAAAAAAATESLETLRADLERDAYRMGGNPAGDAAITSQMSRIDGQIAGLEANGTISPAQGAKYRKAFQNTVFAARTQGTFDALDNPDAQSDFALSIMDDYANGTGLAAELSLSDARDLSNELFSRATQNRTRLTTEQKAEQSRISSLVDDDIASIAATGQGLGTDAGLSYEAVEGALGTEAAAGWQQAQNVAAKGWQATAGMEIETPAEINARLEALQPAAGSAGFAEQQVIHETARKRAQAVLEERATDPLGQANRAGLIELKPIDTTSPETLATSLGERRLAVETVSSQLSVNAPVFTAQEQAALVQVVTEQPELLVGLASTFTAQLGDLAPQAMAQISDQAPVIGQAAGIAMATGDPSVAADIGAAMKARNEGLYKVKMPSDGELATAAGQIIGPALSAKPQDSAAVLATATLLFEKDANSFGLDVGDVGKLDTPANDAWRRALDRALGARSINGEKWGGIGQVNGRPTVVPSFMLATRPQAMLDDLQQADLDKLPPIQTANGIAVTAEQLKRASLVAVGDGEYRVAIGDPEGFDPQYLMGADGNFWQLDLEALAQVQVDRRSQPFVFGPFSFGGAPQQ